MGQHDIAKQRRAMPGGFIAILSVVALLVIPVSAFCQEGLPFDSVFDAALMTDSQIAAQLPPPAPPTNLVGADQPNDAGHSILLRWEKSADDGGGLNHVMAYTVLRGTAQEGPFDTVGTAAAGITEFIDGGTRDGVDYIYMVSATAEKPGPGGQMMRASAASERIGPVRSSAQWIHTGRINALIAVILLSGSILYFISKAKSGQGLFIRRIAGLDAVDEAVGRATEMGKKIFYVPGIQDMNNVQTIAGVTILGRVARLAASYDAQLDVPVSRSLVMVAARETVKEAYFDAGRPDAYNEDMVHYLTDDQFGYAAGVDGMFVRQKPATVFYMGAFFAESLIMAETGNSIGAIQIAGTAQPAQLPFFVAACDYTLIGEELFAASAYLSHEPRQLGSLKGQDVGKFFILLFAIAGILLATFGVYNMANWFLVR